MMFTLYLAGVATTPLPFEALSPASFVTELLEMVAEP